jgi:hypothetical protein
MIAIEAPWFCIMIGGVLELFSCLNVKITTFEVVKTTFEVEKTTFVIYLTVLSPSLYGKTFIFSTS